MPMEAYIHLRHENHEDDQLVDPILNFHASSVRRHGAQICDVIDGYRRADVKNQGKGVLVEYDLHGECDLALASGVNLLL